MAALRESDEAVGIQVAYFGHDASDSAIRRRVTSMQSDGLEVTGFMMRRRQDVETSWDNVDLGLTHDAALVHRFLQVLKGARRAAHDNKLAAAEVIIARNLDMLGCALLARRKAKLDTPVIYECLDVHRLLTRRDPLGRVARWIEGKLLDHSSKLVVSSNAFLENHFEAHHPGRYKPHLIENRLVASDLDINDERAVELFAPVPRSGDVDDRPLRLGWVGNLRCQRSMELLCGLADEFPQSLEIRLHGQPSRTEIASFEPEIDTRANMEFFGRYQAPEDLRRIYDEVDVVWAGDFMEAGYNSTWLLPNRLYEGGYFSTPSIAPAGTETATWIEARECGFVVAEPLDESVVKLVRQILADRELLAAKRLALGSLPPETFIQPPGTVRAVVESVLSGR